MLNKLIALVSTVTVMGILERPSPDIDHVNVGGHRVITVRHSGKRRVEVITDRLRYFLNDRNNQLKVIKVGSSFQIHIVGENNKTSLLMTVSPEDSKRCEMPIEKLTLHYVDLFYEAQRELGALNAVPKN